MPGDAPPGRSASPKLSRAPYSLHPPRCSQERKYVEQHKGALHKPLPTALMNKAFKHFQQDQSENSVG